MKLTKGLIIIDIEDGYMEKIISIEDEEVTFLWKRNDGVWRKDHVTAQQYKNFWSDYGHRLIYPFSEYYKATL